MNALEASKSRDKQRNNFREIQGSKVCPLLGYQCNVRCVCHRRPRMVKGRYPDMAPPDDWSVEGWECGNAMFNYRDEMVKDY